MSLVLMTFHVWCVDIYGLYGQRQCRFDVSFPIHYIIHLIISGNGIQLKEIHKRNSLTTLKPFEYNNNIIETF